MIFDYGKVLSEISESAGKKEVLCKKIREVAPSRDRKIILLVLSFLISKILFSILVIFKSVVFISLVIYPSPIGEHEG